MSDLREPAPAEYVAIWSSGPPVHPDELTFEAGARITVTEKDVPGVDGGWWVGYLPDGRSGLVPANWVKLAPQEGLG